MRISDWSSDVCSSDLRGNAAMGCRIEVGTKRVVLLFGPWAVKIPHPRNRHVGLRANRREIDIWAPSRIQLCRSEEHTSELQSLMRISYAVFCLKKKKKKNTH